MTRTGTPACDSRRIIASLRAALEQGEDMDALINAVASGELPGAAEAHTSSPQTGQEPPEQAPSAVVEVPAAAHNSDKETTQQVDEE